MAQIKEIRVKYDLDNENDRIIYEKLTTNTKQPGRIIKTIVQENIDNDLVKNNSCETEYTKELLRVIRNLSDKIDNLNGAAKKDKIKSIVEDYTPTDSISIRDTNDIEF